MIMQTEKTIRSLRFNYYTAFLATLAIIVAFEGGFLHKGALAAILSADDIYLLEVTSVMITIALIPIALKSFTRSMKRAAGMGKAKLLKTFGKMSIVRISLLFAVIVVNAFIYYGLNYTGALYCGLFGYCALIYSYPTANTLKSFTDSNE